MNKGASLLSEDIKFFFNIVKTKPENAPLANIDEYDTENGLKQEEGYYGRE